MKTTSSVWTRRTYRFEEAVYIDTERPVWLKLERTELALSRMLTRIWAQHGGGRKQPALLITKGTTSQYWTHPKHRIELCPDQMGFLWLIHEIVHALGYWRHDRRFNQKYIRLIAQYARIDEEPLLLSAQMMGLRVLG